VGSNRLRLDKALAASSSNLFFLLRSRNFASRLPQLLLSLAHDVTLDCTSSVDGIQLVDFRLSTLLKLPLVEFLQASSCLSCDGLNPAVASLSLSSFNGNSFININNNLGPLLEIMLAYEHLRTCIAHINLF
jgi:thiol-disulfide isomerase/thioredoxin